MRHSTLSILANEVSVTIGWDPPTETGGRDDLTYTVTVSLPAQLSATVLTSTSVTLITQYKVNYTVSVVATNCAGNSTTAEYSFRIGEYYYFGHSVNSFSGNCPVLTNPINGALGPVSSRLPGSTVTIQCDVGHVSAVTRVTCEGTLMWSPDPEAIECAALTTPTTREFKFLVIYLPCVCAASSKGRVIVVCVCRFLYVCGHKNELLERTRHFRC